MYLIKSQQKPQQSPGTAKWLWEQRQGFFQHRRLTPQSINNYENTIRRFVSHFEFVSEPLNETHLNQYAITSKNELTEHTHANMINQLILFFKYLNAFDLYPNKVADRVRKAKALNHGSKFAVLTDQELDDLFSVPNQKKIFGLRDYAILRLIQSTGIRSGEVTKLNVNSIIERPIADPENPHQIINAKFIRFHQKKGYETERRLFPKTLKAIEKYLRYRGQYLTTAPLFISHSRQNYGKRLSMVGIKVSLKDIFRKAGMDKKGYSAHALRTTLAVKILRATGSEEAAGSHLGHLSKETIKIYTSSERARLLANNQQNYEV